MSLIDFFKTPPGLKELTAEELDSNMKEGNPKIIDVRTAREYSAGHIKEATSIPLGHLKMTVKELNANEEYVLICATGHRSRAAGAQMIRNGFNHVSHLKGGMGAWNRMKRGEK
ncbi:MAG: rhodanese-like domain-containing protein [Candidatus Thermoplasmatota archaeon]|nr:rhodanese-like domain-containing protein [Candidatus Thermoplasmatota archaeon]